jgi:multiple sugar transport system permease protein
MSKHIEGFNKFTSKLQNEVMSWLLATPTLIFLLVFMVIPVIMAFYLSFSNQRLVPNPNLQTQFVGLLNFQRLLRDENFHHGLVNNLKFAIVVVPVQMIFGLSLALLVNQKLRFVTVFRAIYFSPVAITTVVVAQLWGVMFLPNSDSVMNQLLYIISLGQFEPQHWLRNENLALPAIMILSIWQGVGLQMTIFLAGLEEIPEHLFEAAQIDGANPVQRFFYITLPQLRNPIIFVLVTTTIFAFRLFTPVDVLTQGGPRNATITTIFLAYQHGFQQQRIGYASAITVIFFLVVLGISVFQRQRLKDPPTWNQS